MRKLTVVACIVLLSVVTNSLLAAPKYDSLHAMWKSLEGRRGQLTVENGVSIFTGLDSGKIMVVNVGSDYVEFAEPTNVAGAGVDRRVIPIASLQFRAKTKQPLTK